MAKRLVLMRHAEAALAPGQRDGDLFSVGDLPLSARGRAQAEAQRDALADAGFDAAYASPTKRARETAAVVAEPHGLDVRVEPGLVEFPFARPGDAYADVLDAILAFARALASDPDPPFPGGGRFGDGRARFGGALDAILERHARPLVVAHGLTNRAWLGSVLGMPPARLLHLAQDHACVNVLEWNARGRVTLVALNHPPPRAGIRSHETT